MENISPGTEEDLAIQESIQASLKELIGEAPPPETVQEITPTPIAEAPQEVAQETVLAAVEEVVAEAAIAEAAAVELTTEVAEEPQFEEVSAVTEESDEGLIIDSAPEAILPPAVEGTEDILFEEVLDMDAIQQKLLERIYEDDPSIETSQDVDTVIDKEAAIIEEKKAKLPVKYNSITAKKYVVYVDSENIDFMENLTIEERKELINKILKEQNEITIQTQEFNKKSKALKHAILAIITFIIGFPVMFIVVNKSIESTMTNYQQAKQNVARLYKPGGKIQMEQQQQ